MNPNSVLILGATSGIGWNLAQFFIRAGWTVGVAGRRHDKLESLRLAHPAQVRTRVIDVTSSDAGDAVTSFAKEIDAGVYVHCSGVGWKNMELELEKELATVSTNAEGFARCVGAMFRLYAQTGGHIAVISSIAGVKGLGPAPAYSATKGFQNIYIDALEQLAWLRRLNVTFTDIRPGFVNTALINGGAGYPMVMKQERVAAAIFKAVTRKKRVKIIDWRYRWLVAAWRLLPRRLWRCFPVARRAEKDA